MTTFENLRQEAEGMDAVHQHVLFRGLVEGLINTRTKHGDELPPWIVECYDDLATFKKRFPDRRKCAEELEGIASNLKRLEQVCHLQLQRVSERGLSPVQERDLNKLFPEPKR